LKTPFKKANKLPAIYRSSWFWWMWKVYLEEGERGGRSAGTVKSRPARYCRCKNRYKAGELLPASYRVEMPLSV
jgi:hypothetical protein